MKRSSSLLRLIGLICLVVSSAACADGVRLPAEPSATPGAATPGSEPVVREILAQMDSPPGASGRRLTLVRYTIAPGAQLAPHVHPGVQMASIESGTLSYQVVSGTVAIQRRVGGNGVPERTESLTGPASTKLDAGDVVIEEGQMVHFGANNTNEPVVIAATLITEGAELSVADQ